MSTPFSGRITWWHWMGSKLGENSIRQLIATVQTYSPNASGIVFKVSDGALWQGVFDNKLLFAIRDVQAVNTWAVELKARGLSAHAWAVVRGRHVTAEADLITQVCGVQGISSMILDLHPRDWYDSGMPASRAADLIAAIRAGVGNDFHLGVSFDPRGALPARVHLNEWAAHVNSLHPRIFHWEYSEGLRGPEEYIDEAFEALAGYNLPIVPTLQAYTDPATRARVPENDVFNAGTYAFQKGADGISYFRLGAAGPVEFRGVRRVQVPEMPAVTEPEPVVTPVEPEVPPRPSDPVDPTENLPDEDPVEFVVMSATLDVRSAPGDEPRLIIEARRLSQGQRVMAFPSTRLDVDGLTFIQNTDGFWMAEKRADGSEVFLLAADEVPVTPVDTEPEGMYFQVVTDSLRVREAPSLSAAEAEGGSLKRGEQIEVVADSRTEADGYIWWEHLRGWSAEKKIGSTTPYLLAYDPNEGNDLPEPPWHFEQFPVSLDVTQWFYHYGNTVYAFENGRRWGYDNYSQGLHGGLDFGHMGGATVVAGVHGTFDGPGLSFGPNRLDVVIGDYRLIYGHLATPANYPKGTPVTPDTVLGSIDASSQHLHLEIRYKTWYIVNPLLFIPKAMRDVLLARFPPVGRFGFYSSPRWNQWITPLDQPTLTIGGPLIGPRATG